AWRARHRSADVPRHRLSLRSDRARDRARRRGRDSHSSIEKGFMTPALRLVFWETTKACNLSCRHCRAVPQTMIGPRELKTTDAFSLIDQIARVAKPVLVLSGGEPLFRPDLFDI